MAETKPTPNPAIRRPATRRPRLEEAVWRITPMMKTKQPAMTVVRRPNQSARSPAMRAPKKVPAERIETIRDFFHEGMTKALGLVVAREGSYRRKYEYTAIQMERVFNLGCGHTYQVLKSSNEEVHTKDTGDITGVVTEEDTTKGSEGAHEVRLDSDGSLDAASVDAARRGNSTTRHCGDLH